MRPLLLGVLLASPAFGAETAAFLNVGAGARALGLGGAYSALADEIHALHWNPAGLASVEKREFAASHAELAGGARHDFVAFAYKGAVGTFAGGVTYLGHPDFDGRDSTGRGTGSISASESALALAFARKTELADLGASIKHVRGSIGSAEANGAALDLGARRRWERGLSLGAALRHLGTGLKYDGETNELPMRLAVGAGWSFAGGHAMAAELVNAPRVGGNEVSVGGEYQAMKSVYLRGGYSTQSAVTGGSGFDAAKGLTLGVGLKGARWTIDYAVLPTGELGSSHRFSLGARW